MARPQRPFVAILGGAKLETKIPLIERFFKKADRVLIGGALANEVFYLRGIEVGKSPVGDDAGKSRLVKMLSSQKLNLPEDVVVSPDRSGGSSWRICRIAEVGKGNYIVDAGPKSVELFLALCRDAKTIVWNGPLGLTEVKEFSVGTIGFVKGLSKIRALKIVGGGDTLAVLRKYKLLHGFTFVSTGGGAMLDFLAGKKLPGVEVLKK